MARTVTRVGHRDRVARVVGADRAGELLRGRDRSPVERGDHIAGLQACLRRRSPAADARDPRIRRARIERDAEVGVLGLAARDQLRGDRVDRVGRDRKADPLVAAGLARRDLGVDADDVTLVI